MEDESKALWENIHGMTQNIKGVGSWKVALTNIDSSGEKVGANASTGKCKMFQDRINGCELMDIQSSGHKFTWRSLIHNKGMHDI